MSKRRQSRSRPKKIVLPTEPEDLSDLNPIPVSYQQVEQYVAQYSEVNTFCLREEVMKRIHHATSNPLICYVTQTSFLPKNLAPFVSIEDSDVEGFDSLIDTVKTETNSQSIDVLFVSNGGSPEVAERIVRLLRENFSAVRFILPANAYSAATMMAFASDLILMTDTATLGPIDPQIDGIPARTILRGVEDLDERLKVEGPEALAAYIHLLQGYSLHLLEICKSAEKLSKELAQSWLSKYMLKCDLDDPQVENIVSYFADYDRHKSHARSIGYHEAVELGIHIEKLERGSELSNLVRSLYSQYTLFFNRSPFYKLYENAYGTMYGRRVPSSQQNTQE